MRLIFWGLIVVLSACKSKAPSEQKGVFANPNDGYFNGEANALVMYEYSFRDGKLPAVFFKHPRTGENIEDQKNGFCIYSVEFSPDTPIDQATEVKLFKSARSVTTRAIQKKSFNEETGSYWDAFKSNLSLRTSSVWISNELDQDEMYGMRNPQKQSELTKTSGGIRSLKRYIEIAKSHEDPNGLPCPLTHPKSDKIQVSEELKSTDSGSTE